MAHLRAGTPAAVAISAAERTATPRGHLREPPSSGSRLRRGKRLLDGIYAGQPFWSLLRDPGLTPNQVWGLNKTDDEWSAALEAALRATRRAELKHGAMPAM